MEKDLKRIAITGKAFEIVDKLSALNPGLKRYVLVSEVIEHYYNNMKK